MQFSYLLFGLVLVSNSGVLRILNYLIAGTSTGGATGAFEQQDALTITPHAAAAIAIILTSFIELFGLLLLGLFIKRDRSLLDG